MKYIIFIFSFDFRYQLMIKLKKLCELKRLASFDFIDFAVPIIDLLCPIKYSPNGKYDNRYFFKCIIEFLETQVNWQKYKGAKELSIKGNKEISVKGTYLNEIHNKYVKYGVYDQIHKQITILYLKTDRESKLKFQMEDSSFVANKGGSVKNNNHLLSEKEKDDNKKLVQENKKIKKLNKKIKKQNKKSNKENKKIRKQNKKRKEQNKKPKKKFKKIPLNKEKKENTFVNFNRYNGRKKYINLSTIGDTYGSPLQKSIHSAKDADSLTLIRNVNNLPSCINTLKNSKVNRYKQYFLADAGYDTIKNKKFLISKGYIPIIKYNRRNTKDKNKIKQNKFNEKEKEIYKIRGTIERFYSWIKNYPVINQNYQKTIESYNGLFSLCCALRVSKRV